jgi:hypothetical protein
MAAREVLEDLGYEPRPEAGGVELGNGPFPSTHWPTTTPSSCVA